MEKNYVIGIDYGTLSARAILMDLRNGEEVASAVYTYPHGVMDDTLPCGKKLPPLYALQHPDDYLKALGIVVREALKKADVEPQNVAGMGIDFTCCTMLPIDENGEPLCKRTEYAEEPHAYVKLWKHHGAVAYADELDAAAKKRGEPWLKAYGGSSSSEWMFPKILEILREAPEIYEKTRRFMEAADWLSLLLTSRETHSAGFAGNKSYWTEEYGYPDNAFFASVDPRLDEVIGNKISPSVNRIEEKCAGYLTEEGAELCGLPAGTPLALPLPDAHSALAALNVTRPGDLMIILGTSTCMITNTEKTPEIDGICAYVDGGIFPGLCTVEAGQAGAGDSFDWFVKRCVPNDYIDEAKEKNIGIHQLLREKASKLKVGENHLIALDWWNGNRCILKNDALSGMIVGLTLQTKPEEIYRAMIEATAYGARRVIENYNDNGIPIRRICVAGGIAKKDPMLMQIYADVFGLPLELAETAQAGARGIALYAAVAAGIYPNIFEAAERYAMPAIATYTPIPENQEKYQKLYEEFLILHDYFGKTNKVMERLGNI
ncbi:MAG: ribulokinase [Clostridia bacterium]|nr:ribulokinase [Clostridia bacterium]